MFIAGGVLSAVLQMSLLQYMGKRLFGILHCNTASGHWKKLEATLSSGAVSSSYNTFMAYNDNANVLMLSRCNVYHIHQHLLISTKHKVELRLMGK